MRTYRMGLALLLSNSAVAGCANPISIEDGAALSDLSMTIDLSANHDLLATTDLSAASDLAGAADLTGVADLAGVADASTAADGEPSDSDMGGHLGVVYVATYLGGLLAYTIDPVSGKLDRVPGSPFDPKGHLYSVAVAAAGLVYAIDIDAGDVLAFKAAAGGALADLARPPLHLGGHPVSMAIDPDSRHLFIAADQAIHVLTIDPNGGGLSPVQGSPFPAETPVFVAVHPSGHFLYSSSRLSGGVWAFEILQPSGVLKPVAQSPFAVERAHGGAIAFHPGGRFLYNGGGNLNGFVVDPGTGGLKELGGSPFPGGASGSDANSIDIAVDPMGGFLFANHNADGEVAGFWIDPGSGELNPMPASPFKAGSFPYSVAIDPEGHHLYIGNDTGQITAFVVDPVRGLLHPVMGSPFPANGLQPQVVTTSLPGVSP